MFSGGSRFEKEAWKLPLTDMHNLLPPNYSGENIANQFIMLYKISHCIHWGQKQIMVHGFVYFK